MSMFLRITLVKWRLFIEIITEKSESVEKLQQMLAQSKIYNIMTGWTDKPELWLQNYVFNLSVNTWALEHISEKLRHQDTGQRSRQLIHLFALHWTSCSAVSIDLLLFIMIVLLYLGRGGNKLTQIAFSIFKSSLSQWYPWLCIWYNWDWQSGNYKKSCTGMQVSKKLSFSLIHSQLFKFHAFSNDRKKL